MYLYTQWTLRVRVRHELRDVWFVMETEHANLQAVHEALAKDRSVFGTRIETKLVDQGRHDRQIAEEYESIVGAEGMITIMPLQFDLYDADGDLLVPKGGVHSV